MVIGVGIGGFIACLTHPVHTGDFGASVIAHMNNKIYAVIGAGVDGDVGVGVLGSTENDEVAGGEFAAIHIGCARTDLFDLALIHEVIECLLPCDHGLGVPSGSIDGFTNI